MLYLFSRKLLFVSIYRYQPQWRIYSTVYSVGVVSAMVTGELFIFSEFLLARLSPHEMGFSTLSYCWSFWGQSTIAGKKVTGLSLNIFIMNIFIYEWDGQSMGYILSNLLDRHISLLIKVLRKNQRLAYGIMRPLKSQHQSCRYLYSPYKSYLFVMHVILM